jgi:hypothetical protein
MFGWSVRGWAAAAASEERRKFRLDEAGGKLADILPDCHSSWNLAQNVES